LLIFERYGACERLPALLAQPLHILRVENPSAIVLSPHIFKSEAEVVQHRLIHIQHGSIAAQHVDMGRDDVGQKIQIPLVRPQNLFSPFEVLKCPGVGYCDSGVIRKQP
jgi:hypothetical protein